MRTQLTALRRSMAEHHIDAYLIPTADFHGSEYVGEHFAVREYVSGFTGSAGTLLVFPNWAGLWTDGRYFLQAEAQLRDSGIRLMKMGEPGVPTLSEFLNSSLQPGQTLGFDGRCVDAKAGKKYYDLTKHSGGKLNAQLDLVSDFWYDRPPLSARPVWELPLSYAGESRRDKLTRVREAVRKADCDTLLLTGLEDIAWLLNLRGDDIPCNPVFLSYLILSMDSCTLFANPAVFSPELAETLREDGLVLRPYDHFYQALGRLSPGLRVMANTRAVNTRVITTLPHGVKLVDKPSPTESMKAVKNPTECENTRKAHLADGIALTRFLYWLKTHKNLASVTERTAAEYLESLRREHPDYLGPSFEPILAMGEHSAIIHYSATEETNVPLRENAFLLADTGGHYRTGTTDCTRTYALGSVTEAEKRNYTAVLRGNLALSDAVFKAGCTGANLDVLARTPLWELGLDYNHGTGHGVGHLLSVHEGPQNIRWRPQPGRNAPLKPGMITSNEPGVYFDGAYGIRLENLTLCVEREKTDFGTFLGFETLTLTPFDLDAVEPSLLSEKERKLLNDYHRRVRAAIAPHLPPEEQAWLQTATRPI